METNLPSEIELPLPFDVVNANVLDVLTELSFAQTDSIVGGQDTPLVTHKVIDLHSWGKVGYCGEIRLIKYNAQITRLRFVEAPFPTNSESYERFLGKPGATKELVESEMFRIIYREKYNMEAGQLQEFTRFHELEPLIWQRFNQMTLTLMEQRKETFYRVVRRLAQVLKFSLDVQSQAGVYTWGESITTTPGKQSGDLITAPAATTKDDSGVPTESGRRDAAGVVPDQLLPAFTIAREKYSDFSYETAVRILEGLPKAFQKCQNRGGRWGPKSVADEVGINSTTVSRYFAALYYAGIDEYRGIRLPYNPRKQHQT